MNEDALPESWAAAAIEDCLLSYPNNKKIRQGWSPQCESYPAKTLTNWGVLKTTAIQDGYFLDHENKQLPKHLEPRTHLEVEQGDILITCAGPRSRCGIACLVRATRKKLLISGKMYQLRADPRICDSRILEAFLREPQTKQQIDDLKTGMSDSGLNLTHDRFKTLEIPLPPLAEQKRIADKLETVLGRVDACRARLDRVPALLKRFRQSVLAAATTGKLTEEWREENGVVDEWEGVQVQAVAERVFDGPFGSHLKTDDYTPTGIHVARLENIGWMTFLAEKEAFISPAKYQTLARHTLQEDDVVFSSFIAEETRVALLPDSWSGQAINKSDCYCVRVDKERCLPRFLMLRLACRSTFHILGENVHGATRPRINLGQLKNFSFSLPALPEQQEIVRRVEALFALADRIEARLATARKTVERLTPATLAKAFRGELVPQDPNDEPASALLERLQAQSDPATTKSKRGRRAKSTSA